MADIPVRKPLIPITDRETAFEAITQLHKEFLDINTKLIGPPLDDARKGQLEGLLKTILTDLAATHRELQKYPAEVFVPTLKSAPRPMAKGKTSVAVQSAQIRLHQFEEGHLSFATAFKKTLYNEKDRFTSEQKAAAERQYQDLKEEQTRLLKMLKVQESPMRYLALLAQSKVPKNNYLQIGSTKFYMKEDIAASTGIPIFKDYFFKPDDNISAADNDFKLDQLKSIFQKVFTVPQGQALPICDKLDTSYLEEGLKFYLDVLRNELQKKQSERGTNTIPVRTLLVKVEDSKSLIDILLEKQLDICRKGVKEPEPEPEVGHIGADEMKKILRKVILILAAKQKQVPGYEKHMKVADELLALLSPASIPNVENANFPKIEKNFEDVLKSTKNFKMLYMLGKGSADEIIENIQKSFALQLLKKLQALITKATYLTEEEKAQMIEGIDFQQLVTAKEHIELLQQRLLTIYNRKTDVLKNLNDKSVLLSEKLQALELAYNNLNKTYAALQAEHARLKELKGSNPNLETQINELTRAKDFIQEELVKKQNEVLALTEELGLAQEQITILRNDLAVCTTDKDALNATILQLRGTVRDRNTTIQELGETIRTKDATLQETIRTKNAELEKQRQDKQVEIDALTQRISELETLRETLQKQLAAATVLTQEIQYKYSALLQEQNALNEREKSLREQITTLTTAVTKKNDDNKGLAAQLALATKSLSDIQADKVALGVEHKKVLDEIEKNKSQIIILTKNIEQISAIKDGVAKELEKYKADFITYIGDIKKVAEAIEIARNSSTLANLEPSTEKKMPPEVPKPIHMILARVRQLLDRPAPPGPVIPAPVIPAPVVPAPVVPGPVVPGPVVPAPVVPGPVVPAPVDHTYKGLNFSCKDYKYNKEGIEQDINYTINKLRNTMPEPPYTAIDRERVREELKRKCTIMDRVGAPVLPGQHGIIRPIGTSGATGSYFGGKKTRKLKKVSEKKTRKVKQH
jgi:predicted  nucleic acid-binding Zn-ribbon protein